MLLQQSLEHVSIGYTCNTYVNTLFLLIEVYLQIHLVLVHVHTRQCTKNIQACFSLYN